MKTFVVFSTLMLFATIGINQTNIELTQNFKGQSLESVLYQIDDANPSHRFYYFPGWIANIQVSDTLYQDLFSLLNQTLSRHNLFWTITAHNQIIISKTFIPQLNQLKHPIEKDENSISTYSVERKETEDWIILGDPQRPALTPQVYLQGKVMNSNSKSPLDAAYVIIEELNEGAYTDSSGNFSMQLPIGKYHLIAQSLEDGQRKMNIQIFDNAHLEILVKEREIYMDEIVVEAQRNQNVRSVHMGVTPLNISEIKELPTFMGEVDVIKTLALFPGVKSGGELSQGFSVRGSGTDQNLVLFNRAQIFNISHLFGFTSAFNPDVVAGLELYKSSIPAKFGGRTASVTDIQMKIGNKEQWQFHGGVSPLTGRLTIEGPVIKSKSSLIVAGRTSYADWILSRLNNPSLNASTANYYDLNARYHHQAKKGIWDFSGYLSNDQFSFGDDTTYSYQNRSFTVVRRVPLQNKKYVTFTGSVSQYDFRLSGNREPEKFQLDYDINDVGLDVDFAQSEGIHHWSYGLQSNYIWSNPGSVAPIGENTSIRSRSLSQEQGLQADLYVSDEFQISQKFEVAVGLRWSNYVALGPDTEYRYDPQLPRETENILDSIRFQAGNILQYYGGPEYRFSMRYSLNDVTSIKLAAIRTRQYQSLLFNSTTISPTAFWKLADQFVKPQISDQFSLGVFRNFNDDRVEVSLEFYYKYITNLLDYKSGAQLLLNEYLETDLINAKGKGYGIELLIKKKGKILDGWISYAYSRSLVQAASVFPEENINRGAYFPSYFDQPHEAVLVANYNLSRRISLSTNVIYNTGKPLTLPIGKYYFNNAYRLYYSARNEFRYPDYFRMDLSLNIKGSHKLNKKFKGSWTLSVFNVTGRKNAYSIYFITEGDLVQGYKLSIYGRPIASVTYNFAF